METELNVKTGSIPEFSSLSQDLQNAIKAAAYAIKSSNAIVLSNGAGLGVDSGLPDFRGPEGFWRNYPPMQKLGLRFEQMSTPSWFEKDPSFAWGFWAHRYQLYSTTQPHAGFDIMKKWCATNTKKKDGLGYFVFTSNVDGAWRKAGIPDDRLVECHGTVDFLQCVGSCTTEIWPTAETITTPIEVDIDTFKAKSSLPKCKNCTKIARPNVLMFGDWEFVEGREQWQAKNFNEWKKSLKDQNAKMVVIEIGAGKAVPTVRFTSETLCEKFGATLIRINLRDDDIPHYLENKHVSIPLGGLAAVSLIDEQMSQI